jgi:GlpG protein
MHLDEKRLKITAHPLFLSLTRIIVGICVLLFVWISVQQWKVAKAQGRLAASLVQVPILKALMFEEAPDLQAIDEFVATHDLKKYDALDQLPPSYQRDLEQIEKIPAWRGVFDIMMDRLQGASNHQDHGPLFLSIRQGEVWRLVTPTFLHYQFLHLLFNMAWLWMLGEQIENRLGKWKLLLLTLILALVTNVLQYLMTGPLFLGYSGVVVGMAGFIWMRQRVAPWEGYPLAKASSLFLFIFVLAILLLEIVAIALQALKVIAFSPNIANTAHIVGGLVGMGLARIPLFYRKTV